VFVIIMVVTIVVVTIVVMSIVVMSIVVMSIVFVATVPAGRAVRRRSDGAVQRLVFQAKRGSVFVLLLSHDMNPAAT
jgi:hypothetical protein